MAINETYSYKDWMGQTFTDHDASEFNNSEVKGACFYQTTPFTDVFPAAMTGVEFINCNLDGCVIPVGNTLTKSTNLQLKEIDGEDCVVDESEEKQDTLEHYLTVAFWRDV